MSELETGTSKADVLTIADVGTYVELKGKNQLMEYILLSKEGQELMQLLSYKYSVRKDVSPIEGEPLLVKLNTLHPENKTDYMVKRSAYSKEFNRFMGENK